MNKRKYLSALFLLSVFFVSCTTSGPSGIFGKRSPHEAYGDQLKNAGLENSSMAKRWFQFAEQSLSNATQVKIPYSETGYFPADQPRAVGLKFSAQRGEKITVQVSKKSTSAFALFIDMWQPTTANNSAPKLLASADTTTASIEYEVKQQGTYLVRLQPELLSSGEYTLTITNGPSLEFPVSSGAKSNVGSFWGAGRDGGARKHEGIDIFAARRTPLVAAADGVVGAVNENNLGGKVVWLRPVNKDYTLYYAHLDEQLVQPGQRVKAGDTLGLMGNTGNAKTTSPHLHFGIYTNGGAVDPFPFVNKNVKAPAKISAPLQNLAKKVKATKSASLSTHADGSGSKTSIAANTLLTIISATENLYKVLLPNGEHGFIASALVSNISNPIRKVKLSATQPILESPETNAPQKTVVQLGEPVNVLASFGDYFFVEANNQEGWIPKDVL